MDKKYEESLFYQINFSSKYFSMLFDQLFKKLDLNINATEHLALYAIANTKECCQRDLAKIILKDRANTGKLALVLEKKGLINIEVKTKNNRMVKILTITKEGERLHSEAMKTIEPLVKKIRNAVDEKAISETIEALKNFRKTVEEIIKVNI